MSNLTMINVHNSLSFTKYRYNEDIPDWTKMKPDDRQYYIDDVRSTPVKEWTIEIDGMDKNIEAGRERGNYIIMPVTIIKYNVGYEAEKRFLTAKEWKEDIYPVILSYFKNGYTQNGRPIIKAGYRPELVAEVDGGLEWIKPVYSDSQKKMHREGESRVKDKDYVRAEGIDPVKEKENTILVGETAHQTESKRKKVKTLFKDASITNDASLAEQGYVTPAERKARQIAEQKAGGAVSG